MPGWRGGQGHLPARCFSYFCVISLPRKQRPEGSADPGHVLREAAGRRWDPGTAGVPEGIALVSALPGAG